ncbi:hypothetical protein [Nocardia salmonicida]
MTARNLDSLTGSGRPRGIALSDIGEELRRMRAERAAAAASEVSEEKQLVRAQAATITALVEVLTAEGVVPFPVYHWVSDNKTLGGRIKDMLGERGDTYRIVRDSGESGWAISGFGILTTAGTVYNKDPGGMGSRGYGRTFPEDRGARRGVGYVAVERRDYGDDSDIRHARDVFLKGAGVFGKRRALTDREIAEFAERMIAINAKHHAGNWADY